MTPQQFGQSFRRLGLAGFAGTLRQVSLQQGARKVPVFVQSGMPSNISIEVTWIWDEFLLDAGIQKHMDHLVYTTFKLNKLLLSHIELLG